MFKFKLILNKLLRTDYNPYYFGDEDDTISYAIGMNYFKSSTTGIGSWLGDLLNKIEPEHMEIAINKKIERDIEGLTRLKQAGLIDQCGEVKEELLHDGAFTLYTSRVSKTPR